MSDRVSIDIQAGVADIRLNRADKMNALDPAMFQALSEAGKSLAADPDVRAIVLSGEGRCFSAGLDTSNFASMAGGGDSTPKESDSAASSNPFAAKPDGSIANVFQQPAWVWQDHPVPVIAAVHGVTYGGGLQIALAADIRFVAPDARLSVMEIKWGLVPDMSGTQTLRNLVPLDVAKELTFTGRVISGTEAGELGLATHVSDTPREDAMALALEIAGKSPAAVRASKQLLNRTVVGEYEAGLDLEAELQRQVIGTPEQIETVKAQLERRPPSYAPKRK
ncbi:MAG: crotonase/enoyl-CoA hydratase family protein [Myxococcota bacterium]|nr:crotonase/enoyl-CoA hydratase family protein [Myxococcota bacterium]